LIATGSLALIDAVLEFKYLKSLLVRTIIALVSIARRPSTSGNSRKPMHSVLEKSSLQGTEPDYLRYSCLKRTLLSEIHHSWPKSTTISQSKQRNSSPFPVFNLVAGILGGHYENQII
jgi:hypothetical protein